MTKIIFIFVENDYEMIIQYTQFYKINLQRAKYA